MCCIMYYILQSHQRTHPKNSPQQEEVTKHLILKSMYVKILIVVVFFGITVKNCKAVILFEIPGKFGRSGCVI